MQFETFARTSSFFSVTIAEIIHVPDHQRTIQRGIDHSQDGDTVLVAPGLYEENIDFNGHNITLASYYLTTGDTTYIDSTVIDGRGEGSVVSFVNGENQNSVLTGLTIRNCSAEFGGGIMIRDASPSLSYLCISDNHASQYGGGLFVDVNDSLFYRNLSFFRNDCDFSGGAIKIWGCFLTIDNLVAIENTAECGAVFQAYSWARGFQINNGLLSHNRANHSGGIYICCGPSLVLNDVIVSHNHATTVSGGISVCGGSDSQLNNCLIVFNTAKELAGGFYGTSGDWKTFCNVTISENYAPEGGGIYGSRGLMNFVNCIITDNGTNNILAEDVVDMVFSYSDLQPGDDHLVIRERAEVTIGEGVIFEDPLFVNPHSEDFALREGSPCIDSGDPESERDYDGSRADMGYKFPSFGYLCGRIIDEETGDILSGTLISTANGRACVSDENGYYVLESLIGVYDVIVALEGYNTVLLNGHEFTKNDTVEVDFRLLHPEFSLNCDRISCNLSSGESTEFVLNLDNPANGILEWQVEPKFDYGFATSKWDLHQSIGVREILDNNNGKGVVFHDDRFFISSRMIDEKLIHVINRDGELLYTLDPFPDSHEGMHDLAFDGELLWGEDNGTVFGFTSEGEIVHSWHHNLDIRNVQCVTWDSDSELLWIGSILGETIFGFNRWGRLVRQVEVLAGLRKYGFAYDTRDTTGYPLYIFCDDAHNQRLLYRANTTTGETVFDHTLIYPEGGYSGGAFITDEFYPTGLSTFVCLTDSRSVEHPDRIDIYQLQENPSFVEVDYTEGILEPGQRQQITLSISTIDEALGNVLPVSHYNWALNFYHNARGGELTIPIDLSVLPPQLVYDRQQTIPSDFELTSVYPNPFNASVNIEFSLPNRSHVQTQILDIHGRIVEELTNADYAVGYHTLSWSGRRQPSGIYFVNLMAGEKTFTQKLILTK